MDSFNRSMAKARDESYNGDNEASLNESGMVNSPRVPATGIDQIRASIPVPPEPKPRGKPRGKPGRPTSKNGKKRKKTPAKRKVYEKKVKVFVPPVKVPKRRAGHVYTLGRNQWGQLGLQEDRVEGPAAVPALQNKEIRAVACGAKHTLVLDVNGTVWSFGSNEEKALGRPTQSKLDELTPTPVEIPSKVKQISAGISHSAALTVEGLVYAWGSYTDWEGKRYGVDCYLPEEEDAEYCPTPWPITHQLKDESDLEEVQIIKLVSGDHHIAMLGDNSRLYTCGAWNFGQLGREQSQVPVRRTRCLVENEQGFLLTDKEFNIKPGLARVGNTKDVTDVWAGKNCTYCCAGNSYSIYVCGYNSHSQLGIKANEANDSTVFIRRFSRNNAFNRGELENMRWRQIVGGREHTVALSETGQVYTLGNPANGRLGRLIMGEGNSGMEPKVVDNLKSKICVQIAAGNYSSYALAVGGDLYVWGSHPTFGDSLRSTSPSLGSSMDGLPRFQIADTEYQELQRMAVGETHFALIISHKPAK